MTVDVHIRRIGIRRPEGLGDDGDTHGDAWEGVARRELAAALEALMPAALRSVGLPETAEVAIRSLRAKLVLSQGAEMDSARAGTAWALAIARGVEHALRALDYRATERPAPGSAPWGAFDEGVAVFPGRLSAEKTHLAGMHRGDPPAWWVETILGAGGSSPGAIIERWIRELPEMTPHLLLELFVHTPQARSSTIMPEHATTIIRSLLAAWRRRLGASLAGRGSASAPFVELERATEMCRRSLAGVRLSPQSALADLFLTCRILADHPSLGVFIARHEEDWLRILHASPSTGTLHVAPERIIEADPQQVGDVPDPSIVAGPSAQPTRPDQRVEQPLGERVREPRPAGRGDRTGCAGLLFLIRTVARMPLIHDSSGGELRARLAGIAALVLDRALAGLEERERDAEVQRELPLVQVFTGAAWTKEELRAVLGDPERRLACEGAVESIVGAVREIEGYADAPLVKLVRREGRLRVSRTHADLEMPLHSAAAALRIGGWDIDPGWAPHLGRVIRFHYVEDFA